MRELEATCKVCQSNLVHESFVVFCPQCRIMYMPECVELKDPRPSDKCQREYCQYCVKAQTVWCSFVPYGWDEDQCKLSLERDDEHGRKNFKELRPTPVALTSPHRLHCCSQCWYAGRDHCKPDFVPHCNAVEVCRNQCY